MTPRNGIPTDINVKQHMTFTFYFILVVSTFFSTVFSQILFWNSVNPCDKIGVPRWVRGVSEIFEVCLKKTSKKMCKAIVAILQPFKNVPIFGILKEPVRSAL